MVFHTECLIVKLVNVEELVGVRDEPLLEGPFDLIDATLHCEWHLGSIVESDLKGNTPARRHLYDVLVSLGNRRGRKPRHEGASGHTHIAELLEADLDRAKILHCLFRQFAVFEQLLDSDDHAAFYFILSDGSQIVFCADELPNMEYVYLSRVWRHQDEVVVWGESDRLQVWREETSVADAEQDDFVQGTFRVCDELHDRYSITIFVSSGD